MTMDERRKTDDTSRITHHELLVILTQEGQGFKFEKRIENHAFDVMYTEIVEN